MASDLTPDDLIARLRTRAKPGWVITGVEASTLLDRIEALEAERDTLRRYLSDVVNALLDRLSDVDAERDAARAEVAKLREALDVLSMHSDLDAKRIAREALRGDQ